MKQFNQVVINILAHPGIGNLPGMPANQYDLANGTKIVATKDYPFFGIEKDEEIALFWDGEYIRHANLTWSPERLCNEIANGLWTVAE